MYDLVVLGGGAAGLSVATAAARVGAKVAVIERSRLGGERMHVASVPSKALIRAARLAQEIRNAGPFGIKVGSPEVDFAAVMARVRSVVAEFAAGETAEALRSRGIEVIFGSPSFEAYDTVLVDGRTRVSAHKFVIATGSRPEVPAIPGLPESGYLDTTTLWHLNDRPESVLVLGAGPVALELGQAFARLGSKVTLLTETPRILPDEDPDVAALVQARLTSEGIAFYTDVTVTGVSLQAGLKVVKFRNRSNGDTFEAKRTHLLVAAGRRPNVEGLNLDVVGVHTNERHGIEVDESLQTHTRNILAIGDVLGHPRYTQATEREAAVAFQKAVLGLSKKVDYQTVPRVTFTDPEVAAVGLTEAEARALDPALRVLRVGYGELDRARIDGHTGGLAKVFATSGGRILGASIVGEQAAAVLQEVVLAMDQSISLGTIADTVHSDPTYGGLVRRLALEFSASKLEKGFMRTALRWFYGYDPRDDSHDAPAGGEAERAYGEHAVH